MSTPRCSPTTSPTAGRKPSGHSKENGFLKIPVPSHGPSRNFDGNSQLPRTVAFSVPEYLRSPSDEDALRHPSSPRIRPQFTEGPTAPDDSRRSSEVQLDVTALPPQSHPSNILRVDTSSRHAAAPPDNQHPGSGGSGAIISSYGGLYAHPHDDQRLVTSGQSSLGSNSSNSARGPSSPNSTDNGSQASTGTRYSSIVRVENDTENDDHLNHEDPGARVSDDRVTHGTDLHRRTSRL